MHEGVFCQVLKEVCGCFIGMYRECSGWPLCQQRLSRIVYNLKVLGVTCMRHLRDVISTTFLVQCSAFGLSAGNEV